MMSNRHVFAPDNKVRDNATSSKKETDSNMFTNATRLEDTNNSPITFTYNEKNFRWVREENENIWATYLYNLKEGTVFYFAGPMYFDTTNETTMQNSYDSFMKVAIQIKK